MVRNLTSSCRLANGHPWEISRRLPLIQICRDGTRLASGNGCKETCDRTESSLSVFIDFFSGKEKQAVVVTGVGRRNTARKALLPFACVAGTRRKKPPMLQRLKSCLPYVNLFALDCE